MGPHRCPEHLLVELTLEFEIGGVHTEGQQLPHLFWCELHSVVSLGVLLGSLSSPHCDVHYFIKQYTGKQCCERVQQFHQVFCQMELMPETMDLIGTSFLCTLGVA